MFEEMIQLLKDILAELKKFNTVKGKETNAKPATAPKSEPVIVPADTPVPSVSVNVPAPAVEKVTKEQIGVTLTELATIDNTVIDEKTGLTQGFEYAAKVLAMFPGLEGKPALRIGSIAEADYPALNKELLAMIQKVKGGKK